MTNDKNYRVALTRNDGSEIVIDGDDAATIKNGLITLGEKILSSDGWAASDLQTVVDIAEELWDTGNGSPEHLAAAKKFFEAAEEYGDPRATDFLSELQDNPLVAEAMWLRAADRNAPSPVYSLQEDYADQAAWWRKKIAAVEGNSFDGEAPSDAEIFASRRMKFFDVYKRALSGDVAAMKICLEFCETEAAYWNKREP
ncbi:MAG: hypothetical protein SR1Q7_00245 [Quinella sp. 1Q7]|nr:hypothetical protein [Quinella sp. 1Q7]